MSKVLQKTCKRLHVSAVEVREAIWELAPRDWIGKRKAAIAGVARKLGWDFPRTWNIAHGRARRIDSEEMDRLRAELRQLQEGARKRWENLNGHEARLNYLRDAGGTDPRGSGEGTAAGGRRGSGEGAGGMREGGRATTSRAPE